MRVGVGVCVGVAPGAFWDNGSPRQAAGRAVWFGLLSADPMTSEVNNKQRLVSQQE